MTIKAKALLAGCLLLTGTLFANPTDPTEPAGRPSFNTGLYVTKTNKIRLAVEKTTAEPVTIRLRPLGAGQPCLFSQSMRRKQVRLALALDVSALDDGVYELEISSATDRTTRRITLTTPTDVSRTIVMHPLPVADALLTVR